MRGRAKCCQCVTEESLIDVGEAWQRHATPHALYALCRVGVG